MANIKSQIKRNRTNEAARLRNKSVKSALKTSVRKFREAADSGDAAAAALHGDLAADSVLVRRSSLEDVFLTLMEEETA